MNKKLACLLIFVVCVLFTGPDLSAKVSFDSSGLTIVIGDDGQVKSLLDKVNDSNCLASNIPSPLVQIKTGDTIEAPSGLKDLGDGSLVFNFDKSKVKVHVKAIEKTDYISFEAISVTPADTVDTLLWGPLPTTINKKIGVIIGVVRDDNYALGMIGANLKTLGGYPNQEGREISRGQSAKKTGGGSVLQAYSLDRSRPRNITVWSHFKNMPVEPIAGETTVGSKIAIFGCAPKDALNTIGSIEVTEGLPHPMIDGKWAKVAPETGRSYLIASFGESNIDEMLEYTKRADLLSIYHRGPFKGWGHYQLNPSLFPNGEAGMKECVDKAKKLGIYLGVHTLTNFINTNDPYITPIPDDRLAKTGSSTLVNAIDAETVEIAVASPEYFNMIKANWLKTVKIGSELVRYSKVSNTAPWKLLDCQRGAFGTNAASHKKGDEVGKLLDHPYKVFFPNLEMQREIAINLAGLFNRTGISHMDFDGHEGCWASGQGDYAVSLFAKDFYENLDHTVLNGTSTCKTFYWHINTYCNWGEPWYGGFRASQADYRFNNQPLLQQNYLPGMLGWFAMTKTTSLSDIEWMLTRGSGYDAGFALATDINSLRSNPDTDAILDAIRQWETLRHAGLLSEAQKSRMRNTDNEFHLQKAGQDKWNLYPVNKSEVFEYEHYIRQPGEPTYAEWQWHNKETKQAIQFTLEVVGQTGSITNPVFEIDNYLKFEVPVEVKAGQTLICYGTEDIRLYDKNGRQKKLVKMSSKNSHITKGMHTVVFNCQFEGDPAPVVNVRFKTIGKAELIHK